MPTYVRFDCLIFFLNELINILIYSLGDVEGKFSIDKMSCF